MAILNVPQPKNQLTDFIAIKAFLAAKGIWYERWQADKTFAKDAGEAEILAAYETVLRPFMKKGGYQVADVIQVHAGTPELAAVRAKFLKEHTHSEDEVRFFIEGEGLFWFHIRGEVFAVLCQAGELISVPAGTRHWFDLGPKPFVKAIRIFIDKAGWVPQYTDSGIDSQYNPSY